MGPELQPGKLIGLAEVLGAVGVIVPPLTGILPILAPIAAAGIVILQTGAILTHVRRRESFIVNLGIIVLALFVVVARILGF